MDEPTPAGTRQCSQCNGYGSSLHESADRCTRCNGTGLVPADSEPGRADGQEPEDRST
jgi:DnaJ-class molecular chaperone